MKASPAFTGRATFVPPEEAMPWLMRREGEWKRYSLDYLILLVFGIGVVLGMVLAGRG